MLRVDIALFWVNATEVQDAILERVDAAEDIKALILDLESTDQLDTTSADMLASLREQLAERNVDLYLVHVRWPVRTVLRHHGLRAELGEDHIWHSISQGVRQARRQHQIPSGGPQEPSVTPAQEDEEMVVAPTSEELADDEPLDGRGLRDG